MKLKKSLFSSLFLVYFFLTASCDLKKKDVDSISEANKIVVTNDVDTTNNPILDSLPQPIRQKKIEKIDGNNSSITSDMYREGDPRAYYIEDKKMRERDSINTFTPEIMNNRLHAAWIQKGILDKRERDSLIWNSWQKRILDLDSTHVFMPFSEYLKSKK